MQLSIISFTRKGMQLSKKIAELADLKHTVCFTKCKAFAESYGETETVTYVAQSIGEWAGEQLKQKNGLLFIGACGIAVRAIAPHLTDKLHDSPVLVMDEEGQYVIPILSGHMGGANEIARLMAELMQAIPVITTSTDVNQKFAIDVFAKKNALIITEKAAIARISAKLLDGQGITIAIEQGHWNTKETLPEQIMVAEYPPKQPVDVVISAQAVEFEKALLLKPREYVLGIGCRRGKEEEKLWAWIQKNIKELGITMEQVYALASIDQKKDEEGLLAIARRERLPFFTYSAEELEGLAGSFRESEFVKKTVGVSNVCERAALYASGDGGSLVYERHAEDGMTIAVAKRKWSVSFDEY